MVIDVGTLGTEGPARPPKSISSLPGCIPRIPPPPGIDPSSDWVPPGVLATPLGSNPDSCRTGACARESGIASEAMAVAARTAMPAGRRLSMTARSSCDSTPGFSRREGSRRIVTVPGRRP